MRRWLLLLLVLPWVAFAGDSYNVDALDRSFLCQLYVNDGTVGANEGGSCNFATVATVLVAGVNRNAHVPVGRTLVIERWGLVVTGTLGATEVCDIDLMTDSTVTGAGSSIGRISTNDAGGNEDDCLEGLNLDLDAAGETCTIDNVNQVIPGGGYYRFEFSGGACTVFQEGMLWVEGFLLVP